MKHFLSLLLALVFTCTGLAANAHSKSKAEAQIRALVDMQAEAWNRGDIDSFVTGYWKSEETLFIGANGINKGFQSVVDRYHRQYPDKSAMGTLTFSNLQVHITCPNAAWATGEYKLKREKDEPSGFFTLNLKRFSDGWKIVADHTTARAEKS